MFESIKNKTIFANKYKAHPEAIIISCFFNPTNSPYRTKAFNIFRRSIKHLNHKIIECVIGDATPELEESANVKRVYTKNLLWHKESLLNNVIAELPKKYKYIFWVDADVIFTNLNWIVDGVEELKNNNIIQPFEHCVHLDRDETEPSFDMNKLIYHKFPNRINSKVWRSFCANFATGLSYKSENYNEHGHVGFAWAARRDVLDRVPLYDRALIGGADHIMAHAAAGQIGCSCIAKSFTDDIEEVKKWSYDFYTVVNKEISYVKGSLYHIWHGDIEKREYLKRVQDFTAKTKNITEKDANGLYVTADKENEAYMKNYFNHREVKPREFERNISDDNFMQSVAMGYVTDSTILGTVLGGNPLGAALGDMLNDSDKSSHSNDEQPAIEHNHSNHNDTLSNGETYQNNFS